MAPVVPVSADNPDRGSDDELLPPSEGGPPPIIIFLGDENTEVHPPIIDLTLMSSDDDEDDEMPAHSHEGYELLSQDQENTATNNLSHHEESDIEFVGQVSPPVQDDIEEVSNSGMSSPSPDDIEEIPNNDVNERPSVSELSAAEAGPEIKNAMDEEHIEKIKDVMKSVKLPPFNAPPWTEVVPEEEWKSVLLEKLNLVAKECCDKALDTPSKSSTTDEAKGSSKD